MTDTGMPHFRLRCRRRVLIAGRFYYADQRNADGTVAGGKISGAAHADFYYALAQSEGQEPWLATFVAGEGYTSFPGEGYVRAPGAA